MRREPRALFRTPGPRSIGLAFVLAALFAACRQVDTVRDHFRPESPHAAYAYALSQAGLASAALVRDWIHAAEHALREPHYVRLPYRETGWFPPERPTAVSYRWSARRGQRLVVELELATDDSALVFLDLYRIPGDASRPPHRVLSADSGRTRLEYEARRDADYLLRIQPELLRGGRYTITILATASLAFPVSGRGNHDIGGPFGAPRRGGRRHHGIDIFAPRGTPVVAAAAGTVTRVAEPPIGGKVVWLRDELRGQSLYYAHLDRQVVEPGMRVGIGDTLGFVGNTGNARATPPHLHFGIYRRDEGPVDPLPFVYITHTAPPRLAVDTALVGQWTRTAHPGPVYRTAHDRAPVLRELPRHTPLRVEAATGQWYRVRLPDGSSGFVPGRLAEPIDQPIASERLAAGTPVQSRPAPEAALVDHLAAGSDVPVLGRFGDFLFVRTPAGRHGWLALDPGLTDE